MHASHPAPLHRARRLAGRAAGVAVLAAAALLVPAQADRAHGQTGFFDPSTAVTARAVAQREVVRPGDPVAIAVEITHAPGFHTWPNVPVVPPELGADFGAIPTTIEVVGLPPGATHGPIQWPAPAPVVVNYTGAPVELLSYSGTVIAYVPVVLAADTALGGTAVGLAVSWQACDETTCYFPQDAVLEVPLRVVAPGETSGEPVGPELFAGFDVGGFQAGSETAAAVDETVSLSFFGRSIEVDPGGTVGLLALLLLGAVGGALLNFTPCVLPVIPLKVMSLSRAAGDPRRLLALGVAMSVGVVAFWLVLGAAIATIAGFDAISGLFQTGWFALVVGAVVAAMALGMFGVWEVTLPQAVYRIRPDQETLRGSALFGVLTAVLSTPCTAPFMGAAAAWAATQAPWLTMVTFAVIGAGMAAPYLALSARPSLLSRLPRSGPGSVVLKEFLGLLTLAVAAFFLGLGISAALQQAPDPPSRAYWWPVVALVAGAFAWVTWRALRMGARRRTLALSVAATAAVAVLAVMSGRSLTSHGPVHWSYYTPERFAGAVRDRQVVVLDFTAEWCLNCRTLEQGVLNRPDVSAALNADGVAAMRIDLTGDNPAGRDKLRELGWVGIPLLAVYGPADGYARPAKYDTYTPEMVLAAIAAAGGAPATE